MSAMVWQRFLPEIPPPAFADVRHVVLEALPVLRPLERIDVPTWAERNRTLSLANYQGKWSNGFAPYMTEPARMVTSRRYRAVVFSGPARTAKTEALIINALGHAIACKPRDTLVVSMTQDGARQFSERKLGPLLRSNTALRDRQMTGRGSDNLFEKKFAGGMNLQIRWPVIGFFAQNEYFTVLLTDYDRYPEDIDGEGSAFALAMKRTQQAGSLGMVVAESSPGRVSLDADWTPSTVHEAPPCTGILAEFNNGTRGRLYWTCPHCNDPFRPDMARLHHEQRATPAETARTTVMICDNGCVIAPDRKAALNAESFWLHETADGQSAVPIDDPAVRDSDVVSYAMEGPAAAMQSWFDLVLRQINAEDAFRATNDEQALKATVTLDQGRAYVPRVAELGEGVMPETLKALAIDTPIGMAPDDTAFVTIAVDIQGNRFVVQADAWLPDMARVLIDRFELMTPPDTAPNAQSRSIDPGRYREDWAALWPLFERAYGLVNGGGSLTARAVILDMRGADGVTENAYRFQREARKRGLGARLYLANNMGGTEGDRAVFAEPDRILGKKRKRRSDVVTVKVRTNIIKDEVMMSLTRRDIGAGSYRLPRALPDPVFEEFCAEVKTPTGWEKRRKNARNEALDLAVYGKAAAIVLKAEKIDWARPPNWAMNRDRLIASGDMTLNPFFAADAGPVEPVRNADGDEAARKSDALRKRRKPGFVRRGLNG